MFIYAINLYTLTTIRNKEILFKILWKKCLYYMHSNAYIHGDGSINYSIVCVCVCIICVSGNIRKAGIRR